MTPEQLEAHRVRFEQKYAAFSGILTYAVKSAREGTGYAFELVGLQDAWEGYQWALADTDRAQRAAPGVQGGEAMPYLADRLKDHTCTKVENAGGTQGLTLYKTKLGWHSEYQLYLDEAYALWSNLGVALGVGQPPPQQSAQPVAHVSCDGVMGVRFTEHADFGCALKVGQPLYTSQQPVEVQPVPLTADEVWSNNDLMALNAELGLTLDQFMELVGVITAALGIKPTSSEGGA